MEKNGKISFGKIMFIVFSVLVIGGGVLLLNYRNNEEESARNTKQEQKETDAKKDKDKKDDGKTYESFSYTRKDLCGESDECEKTFTYGGEEYKLVMKKVDNSDISDEMDSMATHSVMLNGIDVTDGIMDHLEKINFTRKGYIAIELTDSLTGKDNALIFYDSDLEIAAAFNSIRSFNYDGSESGKFYRCQMKGEDDILKEYEFKISDEGKFTDKMVSEKKDNCFE